MVGARERAVEIACEVVWYGEEFHGHPDKVARIYGAMRDIEAEIWKIMERERRGEDGSDA